MELLIWLFLTPLVCSIIAFFVPIKRLAVAMGLIPLALLIYGEGAWVGSQIQYIWFPALSIEFYLSMDSLSLLFVYLTALIIPISLLSIREANLHSPQIFYGFILLLQSLLIGFFTARDLALFTIFWEAMLLPLYFIINVWGGPQRQTAALKFLIYMIAGSALMVAAVLFLYFAGEGTFNINNLAKMHLSSPYAVWAFAAFILAFAVKTPLFPFHAWLSDTYFEAPTAGTILLSAILSKAGIYGILRIGMGIFPSLMQEWNPLLLGLAITGVLYGAFAAWRQQDFKRLIAYSSFSHVNFVLAGLFIWNQTAHSGAILQALNHGITIAALFLVAGWLEERLGSTSFGKGGGLAKFLPHLCWLTLFFVLSSVALPGTNNFVGELMILVGLFVQNPWLAALIGLSVVFSAVYMLRWMQKIYFGPPSLSEMRWPDIHRREFMIAAPLVACILWIGLYPAPILKQISQATKIESQEKSQ